MHIKNENCLLNLALGPPYIHEVGGGMMTTRLTTTIRNYRSIDIVTRSTFSFCSIYLSLFESSHVWPTGSSEPSTVLTGTASHSPCYYDGHNINCSIFWPSSTTRLCIHLHRWQRPGWPRGSSVWNWVPERELMSVS